MAFQSSFHDPTKTSSKSPLPNELLSHCWRLMTCDTCLSSSYPCSWCAVSSTCVPNTLLPQPFSIFAPIKSENICPLSWRERWELRSKLFGCRCSTFTILSILIAVVSTLAWITVLWLLTKLGWWLRRKWKSRQDGWWRIWTWRPKRSLLPLCGRRRKAKDVDATERQPLLG